MVKLFELSQAYQALLDTEELTEEELKIALDNVGIMLNDKALNIARLVMELQYESEMIDNEMKRLAQRRISRENRIKSLKTYLVANMEACQMTKAKDQFISVSLVSNPASVDVIDETSVPAEYLRIIPERKEVDRLAILKAYKEQGIVAVGCNVITGKKHVVIR